MKTFNSNTLGRILISVGETLNICELFIVTILTACPVANDLRIAVDIIIFENMMGAVLIIILNNTSFITITITGSERYAQFQEHSTTTVYAP